MAPPSARRPAGAAAPVRLTKVTLTKQAPTVSLAKQGGTLRRAAGQPQLEHALRREARAVRQADGRPLADLDLDLCCPVGARRRPKGIVHPIGEQLRFADQPPYILLDGDDRTGASESGENLTINLDHTAEFRRILIYASIYDGAESFAGLDAVATLYPQHGAPIEMRLDECTVQSRAAALFLIENVNGELVVRRESNYIISNENGSWGPPLDAAYNWGMKWSAAKPKS